METNEGNIKNMFSVLSLALLGIIVFLLFLLGFFVLSKGYRNKTNQSFFLMAFFLIIWITTSYFEDEVSSSFLKMILLEADFASAAFASFMIFLFCADVASLKITRNIYFRLGTFLVPSIVMGLIFYTDSVVTGYQTTASGMIIPLYGFGGIIYNILISTALLVGVSLIFFKFNRANSFEKVRYTYLLIGVFLSVIVSLATNVFFADIIQQSPNNQFYSRLGVFGVFFIVLFPGYAIIKHRLFNIKVITTEILSLVILLTLFVEIFLAESWNQVIVRSIVFAIILILVMMLVRSVDAEVKRKEELQELSKRLASANVELKRLDAAKSEFISIASHQLRTPLTAIKGYISLILEGSYGEVNVSVQDILNKVYTVNNRMTQLVEDLLNISRIESGRVMYSFAPTQLELLVAETVDVLSLMAKERHLYLKINLPKKTLPKLSLDAGKMREVVSNLIDNALKYTPEGGVTVSVEEKGGFACVMVEDTGIGVKPEDAKHLFNKFTRSAETRKLDVSGTGLGLYVGKNFVEAHQGKITVESEGVGKGTRFTVMLPLSRAVSSEEK